MPISSFSDNAAPVSVSAFTAAKQPVSRILIAEELTLVREGIASLCSALPGIQVVAKVSNGTSAFEQIREIQPDLALLDLHLPHLLTFEVLRQVRQLQLHTRCLILAVRHDRKAVREAFRCGASGFILKSSTPQQIADALSQLQQGGVYLSPQIEAASLFSEDLRIGDTNHPLDGLSSREYQVFTLLVEGVRAKDIAERLSLSPKTVDTYRSSLMRKLDIHDIAGLVKFSIQNNLTGI